MDDPQPPAPPRPPTPGGFHFAWIILGVTFLALVMGAAVQSIAGILFVPMEQEFGWPRWVGSTGVALSLVTMAALTPFAGYLAVQFGPRRMMVVALCLLATGLSAAPFATTPLAFILVWSLVIGVGAATSGVVLGSVVVNRWFRRRQGLALGILTACWATAGLGLLPPMASLIETLGWRPAMVLLALGVVAVAVIAALVVRDSPAEHGLSPFGATPDDEPPRPPARPGAFRTLREAAGVREFWLLAGTFFVCGLTTTGLIRTHLVPASMEHGMQAVAATGFLAIIGVFDLVGTLAAGWLSDRVSNALLLAWFYGVRGLSLLLLPMAFDGGALGLGIFAVFYGLDWVATVPPTGRLCTNLFGADRGTVVFGWLFTSHHIGGGVAAVAAGLWRDHQGSYDGTFILAAFAAFAAAAMALALGQRRAPAVSVPRPAQA